LSAPEKIVRFAPSPTGLLHIGNARTALLNALFGRREGGRFILRLDDTDRARVEERFVAAIVEDLLWLGVPPDDTVRQSDRTTLYEAALDRLEAGGHVYRCYETEEELAYRRKRQLAQGKPPGYDRAALKLSDANREKLESEGHAPYWRFKLSRRKAKFDDLVRGAVEIDTASLSDPVVRRGDGTWLYSLTSVIDDIDLGVTHVIRGEDHLTNTAAQLEMFAALSATAPAFAHHNLLTLPGGEGLSKRLGHLSLAALRESGHEPLAVAAAAVLIGTADAVAPTPSLEALAAKLDFRKISHGPARFDPAELEALTAKTLHAMPYEQAAPRLAALNVGGGEAFWNAVRGNLTRFPEAPDWWRIVSELLTPPIADDDRDTCAKAAAVLPPEPWDAKIYEAWTAALPAATGKRGRALFHPLRLALTGREKGPALKALLPLIGRARAAARLQGRSA
jgi:glutamyl-tRNA synthetase